MQIEFTKMHGIGNDFVVIDAINQDIDLSADQVRLIADRHFGVGCDQLLLVERPMLDGAEFRYRIYNADGGEVQQCGNGARCFARFVHDRGLTGNTSIAVETAAGIVQAVNGIEGRDMMIAPPFTALSAVSEKLQGSRVALGGQNLHWEKEGAFTGEISSSMLLSAGCSHVNPTRKTKKKP